jgi:hypothetical protein
MQLGVEAEPQEAGAAATVLFDLFTIGAMTLERRPGECEKLLGTGLSNLGVTYLSTILT